MAFTFQVNSGVKFEHNEKWLTIADENAPKLWQQQLSPVNMFQDATLNRAGASDALGQDDEVVFDFGNHYVGHLSFDLKKIGAPMDAPLHLLVKFAEIPSELTADSNDYHGWLASSWIAEEHIHLDVLPTHIELPRRYSCRYVMIKVLGISRKWRIGIEHVCFTAQSAVQLETVSPIVSKDTVLTDIDRVSLKTLSECMQTVFEDGPKRDRRMWLGDLRLQALTNYQTFRQTDMVKRSLYLFAAMTASDGRVVANIYTSPDYIPDDTFLMDFSLFFVSCLADYYRYTGDKETIKALLPVARQQIKLASRYVDQLGLLHCPEDWPAFIDWGDDLDKTTAMQAVMIYVLKQYFELTTQLKVSHPAEFVPLMLKMSNAAISQLFDPVAGFFTSGPDRELNIASQVWMTMADVLSPDENVALMQRTSGKFLPSNTIVTPYMYHTVVEAFFHTGLNDQAIQLIKEYWGGMVEQGADTFWEAFVPDDPDYSPYGSPLVNSYCHAWSCTPAYLLRTYLK